MVEVYSPGLMVMFRKVNLKTTREMVRAHLAWLMEMFIKVYIQCRQESENYSGHTHVTIANANNYKGEWKDDKNNGESTTISAQWKCK